MFFKFCKASFCISAALSVSSFNPFSSVAQALSQPPKQEKSSTTTSREAQLAQLLTEHNRRQSYDPNSSVLAPERIVRTPRDFFEKPIYESLTKLAVYHFCGFIGYLPYVNTIASYLIAPLIPLSCVTDGYLIYSYLEEGNEVKIQNKRWNIKDFCQIVDYMSYGFAFASAGGAARGLPAFLGMFLGMYVYARASKDRFNRDGAVIAGATGATIPMLLLSYTLPFWVGKYKRIPFAIGMFATYAGISMLMYGLLTDYMENRNEDKISSVVLSSYKWSYLNLLGLWTLCGSEESEENNN